MAASPQPAHVYWSVVFDGEAPPPSVLRSEAVLELAGRPHPLPIATDVELAFLRREGARPELIGAGRATLVGSVHYRLEYVTRIPPTEVERTWLDEKGAALPAAIGSVRCTLRPMAEVEASEAQAIVRERAGRILEGAEAAETEAESAGVTESPAQGVEVTTKSSKDPVQGPTVSAWLEHRLSPAVRQIVELAERLAAHSGADEPVTSAHLLDAILNVGLGDLRRKGGDAGAAARFVRMLNARHEGFVPTRTLEAPPSPADSTPDRTVAADAAAIFAAAVARAQRLGQADGSVSARLLVFALLDADGPAVSAHDLLRSAGFDPRELRQAFLQSLVDEGLVDERPTWQAILLTPRLGDQRRWLPSFNADLASGEDKLGLRPDIDAMASLIVSRSLHPPLSIGLFGNWGSGKSFFMQKLREQIRDLARDRSEESRGLYWPNVVTVEFNAWHYVDANLWASLVAHLFGQLRLWGSPEDGVAEQVRKQKNAALNQLKVASEAREAAQKRLGDAERALDQARKRHDDAVGSVRLNTYTLGVQLARNLWAELKEKPELSAPLQEAATKLHEAHLVATDSVDSVERLHAQLKELGESGGRLRATGWLMLHGPGRRSALLWLLGGTALALGLSFKAVGSGFDFGPVASIVTQAVAIVIAGAQWITRSAAEVSRLAKPMEAIRQKIEHSLQALTDERNRMVAKFQKEVDAAMVEVTVSTQAVADAEQSVNAARAMVEDATTARMISRFIEGRAASDDYRKHLGIVSTIREDFDRLSRLITTHNDLLLKTPAAEVASRADDLGINRIVLFIDDLDRCPPARVVEVLQAIHLLLAFPLFVVVVGVDSRWVEHSLAVQYPELLKRARETSRNGSGRRGATAAPNADTARPGDYLEKIFQIPYRVRPLDDAGCRNLIDTLVTGDIAQSVVSGASVPGAVRSPVPVSNRLPVPGPATGSTRNVTATPATPPSAAAPAPAPGNIAPPAPASPPPPARIPMESLRLTPAEIRVMKELAPLIGRSPRATKRFVNIYRLIKAAVPPEQQAAYLQGGFRLPMLLLATATQEPDLARILGDGAEESAPPGQRLWQSVSTRFPRLTAPADDGQPPSLAANDVWSSLTPADLAHWRRRIAQFSFEEAR